MNDKNFNYLSRNTLIKQFAIDKRFFDGISPTPTELDLLYHKPDEMFRVGKWYFEKGRMFDCNKALNWLFKADDLGNKDAAYLIGRIYYDYESEYAVQWFKKSALSGERESEYFLGEMYANGKGILKDVGTALVWYTRAASRGHPLAQLKTGLLYATTPNHRESAKKAFYWLEQVAASGDEAAVKALELLKKNAAYNIEELVRRENPYPHLTREADKKMGDENRSKGQSPLDTGAKDTDKTRETPIQTESNTKESPENKSANNIVNKENTSNSIEESPISDEAIEKERSGKEEEIMLKQSIPNLPAALTRNNVDMENNNNTKQPVDKRDQQSSGIHNEKRVQKNKLKRKHCDEPSDIQDTNEKQRMEESSGESRKPPQNENRVYDRKEKGRQYDVDSINKPSVQDVRVNDEQLIYPPSYRNQISESSYTGDTDESVIESDVGTSSRHPTLQIKKKKRIPSSDSSEDEDRELDAHTAPKPQISFLNRYIPPENEGDQKNGFTRLTQEEAKFMLDELKRRHRENHTRIENMRKDVAIKRKTEKRIEKEIEERRTLQERYKDLAELYYAIASNPVNNYELYPDLN